MLVTTAGGLFYFIQAYTIVCDPSYSSQGPTEDYYTKKIMIFMCF